MCVHMSAEAARQCRKCNYGVDVHSVLTGKAANEDSTALGEPFREENKRFIEEDIREQFNVDLGGNPLF